MTCLDLYPIDLNSHSKLIINTTWNVGSNVVAGQVLGEYNHTWDNLLITGYITVQYASGVDQTSAIQRWFIGYSWDGVHFFGQLSMLFAGGSDSSIVGQEWICPYQNDAYLTATNDPNHNILRIKLIARSQCAFVFPHIWNIYFNPILGSSQDM